MIALYIVLGLIAVFLAVILLRAAAFRPKEEPEAERTEEIFDREKPVKTLSALLRCRTVSHLRPEEEDDGEFQKLTEQLPGLFPNVFAVCGEPMRFEGRALLFCWKGRKAGEPAVLMSHYDVVPVKEEAWTKPPFSGLVEDGVLWGRGALDTKVTMNAVLSAADHLIGEGFVPEHDVYFAFSGSEETNGPGAEAILRHLQRTGCVPSIVLDEGGAVVQDMFPGVKEPCAMVGIAEKGQINLGLTVESSGGHASAPPVQTPIGILSQACCRLESHPFPGHVTAPIAAMFDTLGRRSTFVYRILFANLWCFRGVLDLVTKKSGGELNALMRTTVAFTQMEGSDARNVLPNRASMVANMRLNPEDTVKSAFEYVKKTVNDDRVKLEVLSGMEPSRISTTGCPGWEKLKDAIRATWKGSIVSPYLMVQCSDCRHYGAISDRVFRFSAMDLTAEERRTIHGNDERIRVDCVGRSVEFYLRLMRSL